MTLADLGIHALNLGGCQQTGRTKASLLHEITQGDSEDGTSGKCNEAKKVLLPLCYPQLAVYSGKSLPLSGPQCPLLLVGIVSSVQLPGRLG